MPWRSRGRSLALFLAISSVLICGCDWDLYHLYNGIPMPGNEDAPVTVHVYLAVDGLDAEAVLWAREQGAFLEPSWAFAPSIPMFPATSYASWSRILQTAPLPGFEYEYYDPIEDEVFNHGDLGLVSHIVPPLEAVGIEGSAYFQAFDHHANGYLDVVSNYSSPFQTFARGLDDLFYVLNGRTQDSSTFAGYIPQTDIIGHSYAPVEMLTALLEIERRIESFRDRHPAREFLFTLFSDHGMNFTPTPPDQLVELDEEMDRLGVRVVAALEPWRERDVLVAIPILHSRVTYVGLHTFPGDASRIAAVLSAAAGVDLTICRGVPPPASSPLSPQLSWYQLWREQDLLATFGYDAASDRYYLPRSVDWRELDLELPPGGGKNLELGSYSDEELFGFTFSSAYPDLFYRVRTAFDPISVRWPADVLVSFELGWVSAGFSLGSATDNVATEASHGALLRRGSLGVLLTQERQLPSGFRADNLLEFFPELRTHITEQRDLVIHAGDAGRALQYSEVPWD